MTFTIFKKYCKYRNKCVPHGSSSGYFWCELIHQQGGKNVKGEIVFPDGDCNAKNCPLKKKLT